MNRIKEQIIKEDTEDHAANKDYSIDHFMINLTPLKLKEKIDRYLKNPKI
jgi:hypothetical protein